MNHRDSKHDVANKQTNNSRNDHGAKKVESELGAIELEVPRDRQSESEPILVKKQKRRMTNIEEQATYLYVRGVSAWDMESHLHPIYGMEISEALVSNLTDRLLPKIQEWQIRPLEPVYAFFLDAIHYKVR